MTITERVSNILKYSRDARNSDDELQIIYMQKSGMDLTSRQIRLFKDLPSMETIRRIRQKLQEQGKYPADHEVNEARYAKHKAVRESARDVEPQRLERILEDGTIILPNGSRVLP